MFTRTDTDLDTSLFDPEHDMDLIALANNARTEGEFNSVVRMSRARMRTRRAELKELRRAAARERR